MQEYQIEVSELSAYAPKLRAGDRVLLSGTVYTARDAAHKRFTAALQAGEQLPIPLEGAVLYYAGPTPAREGMAAGSFGPTTSGRMDPHTPALLDRGLAGMIGKGQRSQDVLDAIVRNKAVYLCAIGGAGALACRCIRSCEVIAYEDLGCESVKKLEIQDFPLVVGADCSGGNIFKKQKGQE